MALSFSAGHRKTILKGIEELRRNKRLALRTSSVTSQSSKDTLPRIVAKVAAKETANKSATNDSTQDKSPASGGPKLHWSELERLSNDSSRISDAPSVTSLSYGNLDEDAERAAFQAAVMEWRMAGKASGHPVGDRSPRFDEGAPVVGGAEKVLYSSRRSSAEAENEQDSAWHDPFYNHDNIGIDEAKEHEVVLPLVRVFVIKGTQEFVKAVEEWRSGRSTSFTRQRVANLVSNLEEEYALQAKQLETQHAVAIDQLNKVFNLV